MYGEAFIDEQDSEGLSEAKTFNEYTSQAQEQWLFNGSFFLNSSSFRDHLNKQRRLQTSVDTNAITNPVFCLSLGTSMMFTIENPSHYPVYLKDSVMNSNPTFDYGQFLVLQTSMKYKIAQNSTEASIFAFTFTEAGSYVFADASDYNKIMLVKVLDQGESCQDSDRYI